MLIVSYKMPKVAIDYSKTIIYKLVCNDLSVTDLYVGHTTSFTKRKTQHKHTCCNENNRDYNFKVYQFIRENGGWENWTMVQVEEYICSNKREAEARERYWYEELKGTLNTNYPARTYKEWVAFNKAELKEYYKQHREENKEKKKQYDKERYKTKKTQYSSPITIVSQFFIKVLDSTLIKRKLYLASNTKLLIGITYLVGTSTTS